MIQQSSLKNEKDICNTKESLGTTQWTFDLSLASEEQCELLIFTLIFWQSKILKFRGDCEHILSEIRHDMADFYLKML